jgi:Domain of unknown function (DUF4150)
MSLPHVADGEVAFQVVNVTPDFCKVDGKIVPFEIFRDLANEKASYAATVRARGYPTLKVGSLIEGVVGNMGHGVISTVAQGSGDVLLVEGSVTIRAEGQLLCRDGDRCLMNGK